MAKIKIKIDPRYTKRKISQAVGKNIFKTFTEPITNCDDSYRRIENKTIENSKQVKPTTIIVERKNRKIQIIDQAEGMDVKDFIKNFELYGADRSGWSKGIPVRGIFGQGIEDVLYYHDNGIIKSIKNNKNYSCKFFWENNERYIDPEELGVANEKIRKELQIPKNNGTLVEFILAKDTPIHTHENLTKKLSSFYMLRFINSDPYRGVTLIDISRDGVKRIKQLDYVLPTGEILDKKEFTMQFENYKPVKIEAEIRLSKYPLPRVGEERESGLLVFDEKDAVYDFTFFGLDNDPGTEKLFGFIKLTGAREIILDKINKKDHPEGILTDSRDGFDEEHPFYKKLVDILWNWLWSIVSKQRDFEYKEVDVLPPEVQKKYKEIFDIINKSYNDVIGDTFGGTITTLKKERPIGGIEFARPNIKITVGRKYGLQIRIDVDVIPIGSKIKISSEKGRIGFTPSYLILKKEDKDEENIISKIITINPSRANIADTIKATFKKRSSTTVVTVIEEEVFFPVNGLEFHPDYSQILKDQRHKLNLFVDFNKINDKNEQIKIESDNPFVELEKKVITLHEVEIISEKIGRVNVFLIGRQIDQKANIKASIKSYNCIAKVSVKEKIEYPSSTSSGRFRDWDFEKLPLPMQSLFDSTPKSFRYGLILINKIHPLNKKYFGDDPKKINIESSLIAQVYLAELILNRCLDVMIQDALGKNILERRFPDHEHLDISNYIEDQKNKIGLIIHDKFVNHDLLEEMKKISKRASNFLESIKSFPSISEMDLEKLDKREKEIIKMRLALGGGKPCSLEEIGERFDLTRERVRQIIEKAFIRIGKKYSETNNNQEEIKRQIPTKRVSMTINSIIDTVAKFYGINSQNILEEKRKQKYVFPRMITAFLMREKLKMSFPAIGKKLGRRDHTTVIHAYKKISKIYKNNEKIKNEIENIVDMFKK